MASEKTTPAESPTTHCDEHGCKVVSCVACMAEIPEDVALSSEGPDYVQYFCGLDCLAQWQEKSTKPKP